MDEDVGRPDLAQNETYERARDGSDGLGEVSKSNR